MSGYLLPIIILFILLLCIFKRLPAYDIFTKGANDAITLCIKVLPNLIVIFMMIELLNVSGVLTFFIKNTNWLWKFLKIPSEIAELIILKPFSGSGSLAIISNIYKEFGTDSYIGNCASIIMGASDTLFYMIAVYFSTTKIKNTGAIIPISLISCFIGNIVACMICYLI